MAPFAFREDAKKRAEHQTIIASTKSRPCTVPDALFWHSNLVTFSEAICRWRRRRLRVSRPLCPCFFSIIALCPFFSFGKLFFFRLFVRNSIFVWSRLVNRIKPHLVQKDEKHQVITQASDPVRHRHHNNKRENIVDKGVEGLFFFMGGWAKKCNDAITEQAHQTVSTSIKSGYQPSKIEALVGECSDGSGRSGVNGRITSAIT